MLYKPDRDEEALVLDNLDILDTTARHVSHHQTSHTAEDLRQEGYFGLAHAARHWDKKRPFRPYARSCVSGAMRGGITRTGDTIRLPDHKRRMRSRVRAARATLAERNGENPRDCEVAAAAEVPEPTVRENLTGTRETVYRFSPDSIQRAAGQSESAEHSDAAEARVEELMADAELTERETQILNLAFGLSENIKMTTSEIADELNLSPGYVSRVKAAALGKMRAAA